MKRVFITLLLLAASISGQNSFSQDTGTDYPLILAPPVPLKDVFPVNGTHMRSDKMPMKVIKLSDSEVARIIAMEIAQEPKVPLVYYTIKSKSTGLAIAVSAAGKADREKIIQWTSTLGDEQKWELRPARDGYFNLVAKHSGEFLTIRKADESEGAGAIQWRDSGGDEQLWKIEMDSDGYARIIARHSGKCLAPQTQDGEKGQPLVQRKQRDSDNQKWLISVSEINCTKAKK